MTVRGAGEVEYPKSMIQSGDDIREKAIFQADNLVFELQLLFLEARQRQLIVRGGKLNLGELCVKLSVLATQLAKLFTQQGFFLGIHEGQRAWVERRIERGKT